MGLLAAILAAKEQGIGAILAFAMAYLRGRHNGGVVMQRRANDVRHYRLVHRDLRLRHSSSNLCRYIMSVFIGYIGTDSIGSLIKRFVAKKAGIEVMVEINNQRKAFLDMLAGRRERQRTSETRNHGYDVIVGGELFTDYSDHPRANLSR